VAFVDAFVYGLSFALALERVLTKFDCEIDVCEWLFFWLIFYDCVKLFCLCRLNG